MLWVFVLHLTFLYGPKLRFWKRDFKISWHKSLPCKPYLSSYTVDPHGWRHEFLPPPKKKKTTSSFSALSLAKDAAKKRRLLLKHCYRFANNHYNCMHLYLYFSYINAQLVPLTITPLVLFTSLYLLPFLRYFYPVSFSSFGEFINGTIRNYI